MEKLDKKNIEDVFALTPMQEGMLFHYLKEPESDLYFEQLNLEISSNIDFNLFEHAWNFVIESNEMLRTVFRWQKVEHPIQIVLKEHKIRPGYYDLSAKGTGKKEDLEKVKDNDKKCKFDLQEVPFRITLCKIQEDKHEMIISNHHILYDGWSNGIILKEFFEAYNDLSDGKDLVGPVKTKFKEFVKWNQNLDIDKQKKFWKDYLSGFDTQTELLIKRVKEKGKTSTGQCQKYRIQFEKDVYGNLEGFVKKHKLTLASLLYTAWGILLQRYNNTDDVMFGTTVSGRSAKIQGIEEIVGLLINTLPLRVQTFPNEKTGELLYRIDNALKMREEYEQTPLVNMKEYSEINHQEELFDSIVIIENYPLDRRLMADNSKLLLYVDTYSMVEMTYYDLTVTLSIYHNIDVNFTYNRELFDKEAVVRLSNHFMYILHQVGIGNSLEKDIHQFDILSEAEKRELLFDFNDTEQAYDKEKTIHVLFEEQVDKTPDNIGIIAQNAEERHTPYAMSHAITYRELNKKSNQLAHFLKEKCVGPDTIVGIMVKRSFEMAVGIMGILKAGGAYLPIDPNYPRERIDYMLKDSNAKILLTDREIADLSSPQALNNRRESTSSQPHLSPAPATSLAYIIYTSGSTGKPKGVLVQHRSVVNILVALFKKYPLLKDDTYLLKTTYTFDVSVSELFGWYLGGGRLAILEPGGEKEPLTILNWIESLNVTHINFVPSMFRVFMEILDPHRAQQLATIKYIFLAGETLVPDLVTRFNEFNTGIVLENIYGPTESTIYSSQYSLSRWPGLGSIPIGKPLSNIQLYILNPDIGLQPIGISGELYIGGEGLARGYLNRPELTAEKFKRAVVSHSSLVISPSIKYSKSANDQCPITNVRYHSTTPPLHHSPHPHHSPYSPIYKTGDLARWMPDGNIEFLGRIDRQIKIRGLRIELGEIENQLLKHSKIRKAVVLAREDKVRDKYLCAYIVYDQEISVSELKEYLSRKLPDYMIISYFVKIEKIPLTPNGKIDKRALPEPEIKAGEGYIAPGNIIEEKLVAIWASVLKIEKNKIGIEDNFFELGGHSLKATILVSKIHKVFDVKVPFVDIFKIPRIRELARYIKDKSKEYYIAIEPVEEKEYHLLSSAQNRLYILQQMNPDNTAYNMPAIIPFPVVFDLGKIAETFKKLIKRHESLRTSFHMVNDMQIQVVHDEVKFEIEYYQVEVKVEVEEGTGEGRVEGGKGRRVEEKEVPSGVCGTPSLLDASGDRYLKSQELRAKSFIKDFIRPFDLSNAPLLRVGLIKFLHTRTAPRAHPSQDGKEDKYLLLVDMHHIISDGVSHEILVKDFLSLHQGEELLPLRVQYKDFSHWQNGEKEKENIKRQEKYWLKEFDGEIPVLELLTDYPRPVEQSFEGDSINFEITAEETRALNAVALTGGSTLFMVLTAVVNTFLSKLSGQEEIIIGTPIAARRHSDLKKIIGMFVNTLSLRNYPAGDRTFREFLGDVKERVLMAFENQEYPFEELVDKLSVKRDIGRNPLFDVMFVLKNMNTGLAYQDKDTGIENSQIFQLDSPKEYENIVQTAKFDLTIIAEERGSGLFLSFKYCTKLFKRETIERFINYFKKIVSFTVKEPGIRLSEIEIISEEERNRLLYEFNDTEAYYPKYKTIHQLFEEQVECIPNHIAVVDSSAQITYSKLNEKSNRLAHLLKEKGIQPDTIVGIKVERSIEMIICILGILKAGGAYLPIDPDYPQERIDYMLKDSGAAILLTENDLLDFVRNRLNCSNLLYKPTNFNPNMESRQSTNSLVYIIYTSGSSGRPKGVMVEHGNLANLIAGLSLKIYSRFDQKLNICLVSPFIFDASIKQIFAALLLGHTLNIVPERVRFDGKLLLQYLVRYNIDISDGTPAHLRMLIESMTNDLLPVNVKHFIIGGEALTYDMAEGFFNKFCGKAPGIINIYGPSECTVDTALFELNYENIHRFKKNIPIGKSMPNCRLYIVDKFERLQPIGLSGELLVCGNGVGRGYLGKQELTFEKFAFDPFIEKNGKDNPIMYRTGDLACRLPDGNIEFLGRMDHQIKIRGFRIEMGELEKLLLKHNDIKEAVVIDRKNEKGDKCLVAYLVTGKTLDTTELRNFLSKSLPDYMIPSYFITLKTIPLTPSGKMDKRALPEPEIKTGKGYIAPGNQVEIKLAKIWAELLGIKEKRISIDSNFFQIGGDSLMGTLLTSRIHKGFDVPLSLAEVFMKPTIRELAEVINGMAKDKYTSIKTAEKKDYYALSSGQRRLYFLQQLAPEGIVYNMPQITPLDDITDNVKLAAAFKQLINQHESLRTSFLVIDDEPVQRIRQRVPFTLDYLKINDVNGLQAIIDRFVSSFELSQAPLLRAAVLEVEKGQCLLLTDMHHIIGDGVSNGILVKDFTALYQGEELPPLRLQYKDFSQWQNSHEVIQKLKSQKDYWLRQFPGDIPLLNLPGDYPNPGMNRFEGDTYAFEINMNQTALLKQMALEQGTTIFMVMLAIFYVLLAKVSLQEDIIIGTAVTGRGHDDLKNIIGMFVNMLALRNYPRGSLSFLEFLGEVKQRSIKAFENQDFQFEKLVMELDMSRNHLFNPLFEVAFSIDTLPVAANPFAGGGGSQEIPLDKAQSREYKLDLKISKFALSLVGIEIEGQLHMIFEYSSLVFKEERIQRFARYFKEIVTTILTNKDIQLKNIRLTTDLFDQKINNPMVALEL